MQYLEVESRETCRSNVFVNIEIIIVLVVRYDPQTQTISDYKGNCLLPITKEYVEQVCGLE